jgi:hypothetical protein
MVNYILRLHLKIERAKKHILDLESEWTAFLKSGGYVIAPDDDLNKRERSYRVSIAKDIPDAISLIAGDAIHNLRSALDHVAYCLVSIGTGRPGPFPGIYFPVAETPAKYKTAFPGKVQGMRQDAIDALSIIEPYGGGKGEILWQLHSLDNIDKHRLLLTVHGALLAHTMPPTQRREIARRLAISWHGPTEIREVMIPTTIVPVKQGDTLLTIPEADLEDYMQFMVGPAFGEPSIVYGKPVIPTLHETMKFVRGIVTKFDGIGLFK